MGRILIAVVLVLGIAGAGYWTYTNYPAKDAPETAAPSRTDTESLPEAERFVEIDGATIRVREEGPTGAPVLLMLHGFTFSLESFDGLTEELSSEYRVVRYDLLGHGRTGPDPQKRYAPTERAAFLGQVIDALGLERPVIVGNSLGGLVAWRYTADNSEKVRALVLVSPGAYPFNGVGDDPAPLNPAMRFIFMSPNRATVGATFGNVYGSAGSPDPERVTTTLAMMEGNGGAYIEALEEFTLPDPEPDLARVTVPALIVWGREDALIPADHGEKIVAAMPDAELILYDNVGHVAQEEVPARVASDMRAFLASNP